MSLSLFLLSAATLIFEINLTRLFSVAQFYHFAFMIVSLALLGFGASGTLLAIFPKMGRKNPDRSLGWLALGAGLSILASYLATNWLPFDSFSIAWDRKQVFLLVLHYLALSTPFFFNGIAVGLLLSARPQAVGQTYAINLLGSASGCLVALVVPSFLGGEGTLVLSSGLAALAAAGQWRMSTFIGKRSRLLKALFGILSVTLLIFCLTDFGLRISGKRSFSFLDLRLSPYKGLSYAMQYPQAEIITQRWNAFSRVDVVRSPGIHSLPGLSYRYLQPPPPEDGLLVDGDELSPIVHLEADPGFVDYLPAAVVFHLRQAATVNSAVDVLALGPRGGLDILTALQLGARRVTAVEVNPLISAASPVYHDQRVRLVTESDRSYMRRTQEKFDVILLSLSTTYHPVRSGAYSLAEDYRYTVESFQDALALLNPDGLLLVTRWLQTPPSECLRTFALAVTALEKTGADPRQQIVAFQGYNTLTLLVKKNPFTPDELRQVREFAVKRAFDLTYAPDIRPEEVNRFNIAPQPLHYQAFMQLLNTQPRQAFYAAYPYDVSPPTDDRPFFGHFFKWSQVRQVAAELGKTWQPFGGAGYFVILALLALAVLSATGLVLLAAIAVRRQTKVPLAYFALIGFAFLLVEIPLIQNIILFLGQPAYSMTAVLFALLLFSGIGSYWSNRVPMWAALAILVALLLSVPVLFPPLFRLALGLPFIARLGLTIVILAPIGFLMGIPFPAGIQQLTNQNRFPLVWAINGAASVISAVLAALLALSLGFGWVLRLGALCYAGALLTALAARRWGPVSLPRP